MTIAEDVLESARWAPSGDNSQPWRFKLRAEREFDVYGYDTSAYCVYDLDRWASELAHGMLLETIAIAATRRGARARITLPDDPNAVPRRYHVALEADTTIREDPLNDAIDVRSVQRRGMRTRELSLHERAALERAAAPYRTTWFAGWTARRRIAALCARNARIRLTIPEAYEAHRSVIAWRASTSEDRMPDASLGAEPLLLATMRYAMKNWARLERLNRWTGTTAPRLALDFVPGVLCSAHFALMSDAPTTSLESRIAVGRATQRLWLTATLLGLQMQPEYTPLVFARYAEAGRRFTRVATASAQARKVAEELRRELGPDAVRTTVWLARIGRSARLPVARCGFRSPS
jgi:nitroreductase